MSDCLVECVPNFSEGRNAATIEALVAAVQRVPGVYLLDQHRDRDHHRSVLTVVGGPKPMGEAMFQATRVAASLIDLQKHEGCHPRVGSTDVIPFIPIRGVSLQDCVSLARSLGERIGRELQIPVFLYEAAATQSVRKNLEMIRRGRCGGLARRMAGDPAWSPDFGPSTMHPSAGATVIGVRTPLIAFNVNLGSTDVAVAKKIATRVRSSSGGPPHVKAMGVQLESRGLVQVSMNLTHFEETPIQRVFELVQREANRVGAGIEASEIVGLVPQAALTGVSIPSLKLKDFGPNKVLETAIEMALARTNDT